MGSKTGFPGGSRIDRFLKGCTGTRVSGILMTFCTLYLCPFPEWGIPRFGVLGGPPRKWGLGVIFYGVKKKWFFLINFDKFCEKVVENTKILINFVKKLSKSEKKCPIDEKSARKRGTPKKCEISTPRKPPFFRGGQKVPFFWKTTFSTIFWRL